MKPDRLAYNVYEACELLSVGRTTLYSAIKKGDLKTCKVGRRTLISAESLKLWLETLPTSLEVKAQASNNNRGAAMNKALSASKAEQLSREAGQGRGTSTPLAPRR